MYDATIIIPTYKEEKTISKTIIDIDKILKDNNLNFEILIVDDSSPDATIFIVQELEKTIPNLKHLLRLSDKGLSQSVVDGFDFADSDIFIVTDADESHDITKIPDLYYEIMNGNDIAIGSRYMKGGGIHNWTVKRKLISRGATYLARGIFPTITDPVSGFFAIKKSVVENAPLTPKGYKILFEILGKGYWKTIKEIPYTFTDRTCGESKLKQSTIREYYHQWIDMLKFAYKHHDCKAWLELDKIIKFMIVGFSGIFINMFFLYVFYDLFNIFLIYSSVFAVELSILSNFLWNDIWTFKKNSSLTYPKRIASFHIVSVVGMIINVIMLYILVYFNVFYLTANLIGIVVAFSWNFFANRRLTWN